MSRRARFKWNRKTYRRAHHLARLLAHFPLPDDMPELLLEYYALWAKHPQCNDRLVTSSLRSRFLMWRDDVPF